MKKHMNKLSYIILVIIGVGLFVFGGTSLLNSNLDSRVWLTIAIFFASGVFITLAITGLTRKHLGQSAS